MSAVSSNVGLLFHICRKYFAVFVLLKTYDFRLENTSTFFFSKFNIVNSLRDSGFTYTVKNVGRAHILTK